jgi:hypothetical protein
MPRYDLWVAMGRVSIQFSYEYTVCCESDDCPRPRIPETPHVSDAILYREQCCTLYRVPQTNLNPRPSGIRDGLPSPWGFRILLQNRPVRMTGILSIAGCCHRTAGPSAPVSSPRWLRAPMRRKHHSSMGGVMGAAQKAVGRGCRGPDEAELRSAAGVEPEEPERCQIRPRPVRD